MRINSLIRFSGVALLSLFLGHVLSAQNPTANPDTLIIPEFNSVSFNPLVNDDDISDILNMEVTIVSGPNNGTVGPVVFASNEFTITYNPRSSAPVFNGIDTLVYEVCDTSGGQVGVCDQAKVLIKVGVFPVFPVAVTDTFYIGENVAGNTDPEKSFDLVLNDVGATSGAMIVELVNDPTQGTFSLDSVSLVYQASTGVSGVFDAVSYAYCDTFSFQQPNPFHPEGYYCDTVQSLIYINQIHSAGNETGDTVILENQKALLPNGDVVIQPYLTKNYLVNNIDPEGDSLLVKSIDQGGATLTFGPDSNFRYTPDPTLSNDGMPAYLDTVAYTVCDTLGLCVNDTMFLHVIPEAIDSLPQLISPDTIRATVLMGDTVMITVNAIEPDGEDIQLEQANGVNELVLFDLNKVNDLTFSAKIGGVVQRTTTDTFTVRVCEVNEPTQCSRAIFVVTIKDTAQAPVALDDEITILEEEDVVINLFDNDELNGSQLVSISQPEIGTFELDTLTGVLSYSSTKDEFGLEEIQYVICRDSCDTAFVKISVSPVFVPLVIEGVSPNGDGVNDRFTIQDVDYDELKVSVKIFNRWGNLVYDEPEYDDRDEDKSWSGQGSNGNVVDGTYFYLVDIPELDFKKSGDLLLISGN